MTTKELELWKGEFGNQYRERNQIQQDLINARMQHWISLFTGLVNFGTTKKLPGSILEVGCGGGINLLAINNVYNINMEMAKYYALEPNEETRKEALKACEKQVFFPEIVQGTAQKIELPNNSVDLVFTSGVLIHINPTEQLDALHEIYRVSNKYIISMEYYSPDLREITYHEQQALWTRDYGQLWLDNFKVRCIGCFFSWKPTTKLDNITTWVFEKVN